MDYIAISKVRPNSENPRYIKDEKFKKLVQSLRDFPEMANVRPIVVNKEMVVLGGNMRLKAMQEAGWSEVPVQVVDWSEEKQREFIIKDNVGFGEWDWDELANTWDAEELDRWGLDVPIINKEEEEKYTSKIETPVYEPKKDKPSHSQLYDDSKAKELIDEINQSDISADDKAFLILAAKRHVVFNFEEVAEFYAHSDDKVQRLMERSAMVIIDFNQAIENGFVELSQEIQENFMQDYEE